jgi:hypothetical protein
MQCEGMGDNVSSSSEVQYLVDIYKSSFTAFQSTRLRRCRHGHLGFFFLNLPNHNVATAKITDVRHAYIFGLCMALVRL